MFESFQTQTPMASGSTGVNRFSPRVFAGGAAAWARGAAREVFLELVRVTVRLCFDDFALATVRTVAARKAVAWCDFESLLLLLLLPLAAT